MVTVAVAIVKAVIVIHAVVQKASFIVLIGLTVTLKGTLLKCWVSVRSPIMVINLTFSVQHGTN